MRLEIFGVAIDVRSFADGSPAGAGERKVRVVPVAGGVIGSEANASFFAGGGKFLDHVPAKGRIYNVVVRLLRIPKAKAIVVLGGEHHVFHAGGLGDGDPLVGIELNGIELFVEVAIS